MYATCATPFDPQVNSFLVGLEIFSWENFILPKPLHGCYFRFIGEGGIARGVDGRQGEEHGMMELEDCAREEREEGARLHGGGHHKETAGVPAAAEKSPILCRAAQLGRGT